MRLRSVIAALFTLTLSIVSTIFVLLALTSRRWAVQKYYADADNPVNWIDPICHANRSPFLRCGYPNVTAANATSNASCRVPDCKFYKPHGWDQTSCRLAAEVASVDGASAQDLVGTAQECQQVHYAGNLQIAASVFITLGLLINIALAFITFARGVFTSSPTEEDSAVTSSATEAVDIDEDRKHRHAERHHAHHEKTKMSPIPSYAAMALLFCLCAGALLQVLAQFFGVLGLTITATGTQGPSTGQNVGVSLWTVDVALSRYATVAWTFSLATATMTLLAYRIPRFAKLV